MQINKLEDLKGLFIRKKKGSKKSKAIYLITHYHPKDRWSGPEGYIRASSILSSAFNCIDSLAEFYNDWEIVSDQEIAGFIKERKVRHTISSED
jgi:predicted phosphoribosyltransferase